MAIKDMVLQLLDLLGATILESRDGSGKTALHYAAGAGERDVTGILIRARADVNAGAEHGD